MRKCGIQTIDEIVKKDLPIFYDMNKHLDFDKLEIFKGYLKILFLLYLKLLFTEPP